MNIKCVNNWLGHEWGADGYCTRRCGAFIGKTLDGETLEGDPYHVAGLVRGLLAGLTARLGLVVRPQPQPVPVHLDEDDSSSVGSASSPACSEAT